MRRLLEEVMLHRLSVGLCLLCLFIIDFSRIRMHCRVLLDLLTTSSSFLEIAKAVVDSMLRSFMTSLCFFLTEVEGILFAMNVKSACHELR